MGFERHGYHFEGAFTNPSYLEANPGVYEIWCNSGQDWKVLDVGEAQDVRARVLSHDRKDCWTRNCIAGRIMYSAHYTAGLNETQRQEIEARLRALDNPVCGSQ